MLDHLSKSDQMSSCEVAVTNIAFKSGNKLFNFELT